MNLLVRNPSFRSLWAAGLLASATAQAARTALILAALRRPGAAQPLAALVTAEAALGIVTAPIAGVTVDRLGRTAVLAAAALGLSVVTLAGGCSPSLPGLLLEAVFLAGADVFLQTARLAAIPAVVAPSDLDRANGLDQWGAQLALVAGPFCGTSLAVRLGPATALAAVAGCGLVAVLAALSVRVARPAPRASAPGTAPTPALLAGALADARDGWSYLARHPQAARLGLMLVAALVSGSVWMPLAPAFIRDHLGGSSEVLGWQLGAFGLGAAVGSLTAPLLVARLGRGGAMLAGQLAEGLCIIAYSLCGDPRGSLLLIGLWGVAAPTFMAPFYATLQAGVDAAYLGRVLAVARQCEHGAVAVGALPAVVLGDRADSRLILCGCGLLYLGVTASSALSRGGRLLLSTR